MNRVLAADGVPTSKTPSGPTDATTLPELVANTSRVRLAGSAPVLEQRALASTSPHFLATHRYSSDSDSIGEDRSSRIVGKCFRMNKALHVGA
jgi:hypothetical protein